MGECQPEAQVNGFCGCNLIALICSKSSAVFCAVSLFKTMGQMYKVFVKDRPIIVSTEQSLGAPYKTFPLRTTDLIPIIEALNKGKMTHVHLYHKNAEKIEWYLKRKLPFVLAAGGLVYNKDGLWLLR